MGLAACLVCPLDLALTQTLAAQARPVASRGSSPQGLPASQPTRIDDGEFWRLITELSEIGGTFPQQLMSNEDSAQAVLPDLERVTQPGGVYVGVGSEQNFTYIAALQSSLSFIVDIRRENMLEMLMYKALFELSSDRAAFVAQLFARPVPVGAGAATAVEPASGRAAAATIDALLADVAARPADTGALARTVAAIDECLRRRHALPLPDADMAAIATMLGRFMAAGPGALKGFGDLNPSFAELMTATDFAGHQLSFLASERGFDIVRDRHLRNLIVPITGDFAGDRALRRIGDTLRSRGVAVRVFYTSNVERYLWEQGAHGRQFYANVAALPREPQSLFIRSVTRDISRRLGIVLPDRPTKWWTVVSPIASDLARIEAGAVSGYSDLFKN